LIQFVGFPATRAIVSEDLHGIDGFSLNLTMPSDEELDKGLDFDRVQGTWAYERCPDSYLVVILKDLDYRDIQTHGRIFLGAVVDPEDRIH
jgi:hypothetical protein